MEIDATDKLLCHKSKIVELLVRRLLQNLEGNKRVRHCFEEAWANQETHKFARGEERTNDCVVWLCSVVEEFERRKKMKNEIK